jgi:Double zinc ribbon
MSDPESGARTATCPDCGTVVRPDRERLCPTCGYPLAFLKTTPEPADFGPARLPGERLEATGVLRTGINPAVPDATRAVPVWETPTPGPGEVVCPRCGEVNSVERVRCQRCGQVLRTQTPPPMPPPEPAGPPPAESRMRAWLPLIWALLVAALLISVAVLLAVGGSDDDTSGAAGQPGLVRADVATIRASASSTNPDPRFPVRNLLDGDPRTPWQSDGERVGGNVGVSLTFEFGAAVQLARVTLVNGDGRGAEDYQSNERATRLRLSSGGWSQGWDLRDTGDPQSLDIDPGPISTLTLAVEAVYLSSRFPDLAISEVTFEARP